MGFECGKWEFEMKSWRELEMKRESFTRTPLKKNRQHQSQPELVGFQRVLHEELEIQEQIEVRCHTEEEHMKD